MPVIRTTGSTTAGTNVALTDNDGLFVGAGATLASSGGVAVRAAVTDHTLLIQGALVGATSGISLGSDSTAGATSEVWIAEGGSVTGFSAAAIVSLGSGTRVSNQGTVFGANGIEHDGLGIFQLQNAGRIEGATGVLASSDSVLISNAGTIIGENYGILATGRVGPGPTGASVLDNWGVIEGRSWAYQDTGGSSGVGGTTALIDKVRNHGEMRGGVALGDLDDTYDGTDGRVFGLVSGGDGADTLLGGDFADHLRGGAGIDSIDAGEGDDIVEGGSGADALDGGGGLRDLLDYNGFDPGAGPVSVNLALNEVSGGLAAGDVIAGFEWLAGTYWNDKLYGDGKANRLFGRNGADQLLGEDGADALFGDAGADTLSGGLGVDVLRGGADADVFRFAAAGESGAPGEARDRVVDFSVVEGDRIDLAFIDANAAAFGNQAFTFIGAAGFSAAGQVRAVVIGGNTYVSGNTDAATATAEFSLLVLGAPALTGGSFIL
jgi:Ca2+-binding RTX toxin-like protein